METKPTRVALAWAWGVGEQKSTTLLPHEHAASEGEADADAESECPPLSELCALLLQCCGHPSALVRLMVSRALPAAVSPSQLLPLTHALLRAAPSPPPSAPPSPRTPPPSLLLPAALDLSDHNALHGVLLALSRLLHRLFAVRDVALSRGGSFFLGSFLEFCTQ